MIFSMTGFARQEYQGNEGALILELRSLNHRYLELNIRTPEQFRYLEHEMRDILNQKIHRGKVDCYLSFISNNNAVTLDLNIATIKQLSEAQTQIKKIIKDLVPLNTMDILRWPGVSREVAGDDETVFKQQILNLFEKTIQELLKMRLQEGEALKKFLQERVLEMERIVNKLKERLPNIQAEMRSKLLNKIAALQMEVEPSRFEQEVIFQLQRSDIAEELSRLETHIQEVARLLDQGGCVGRRLDFLMQELHREANTLGAKAANVEFVDYAIELKVLIDQMREQIYNIE